MSSKLDYLQKYLNKGDALPGSAPGTAETNRKKKKKVKDKKKIKNKFQDKYKSRIIDEDEAFLQYQKENEEEDHDQDEDPDKFETLEEKPQIAGFVDERPEIEIMKEKFTTSTFQAVVKIEDDDDEDSPPGSILKSSFPPVKVKEEPVDNSDHEERVRKRHDSDDSSPPARSRRRRHDSSSDNSPPRSSRRRHDSSDDNSPRRNANNAEGDISPLRIRARRPSLDSDHSPPRKSTNADSDNSPPRKSRKRHDSSDNSPPRIRTRRQSVDSDHSPPRRRIKTEPDSDISPPRVKKELSPPQKVKQERESDGDISPPRIRPNNPSMMTKTLDGKKAGLQNAKSLKAELTSLKEKERKMFDKLDASVSGRGAETNVRGRLKEKQELEQKKKEENEITDEVKKKYSRWSKGIKQAEVIQRRINEDLAEMDKPLARSADDVDLDVHLRNIERQEDPMLQYIKKKKAKVSGAKKMPQYQGPAPAPNRFKIPPGYRWDGVDRSNGFEKKLFEKQSAAQAIQEDAYKWSTEDM